jgi:(+)-trans-carveol dehydrogenase/(-)-trans-carveol dehydrogenase
MIMNDETVKIFVPGNPHPTREDFAVASQAMNALPIPWVEPIGISKALVFLASDDARYITGGALPVDAGCLVK